MAVLHRSAYHVRHDLFGIGNDTGLLAALLFLSLLAISNDLSLRRLGTRTWKSLQRWTYMAAALTLMHAVAYQLVEKRQAAYDALLWATIAMTAVLQVAGWWRTKRKPNGAHWYSGPTIDGLEAGRQLPTSVDKSLDSAQLAR